MAFYTSQRQGEGGSRERQRGAREREERAADQRWKKTGIETLRDDKRQKIRSLQK